MSTLNLTYIDYAKKDTQFGVPMADITAVNHDAQLTLASNIQTASDVCTEAAPIGKTITHSNVAYVPVIPSDESATRKRGVAFTLRGNTNPKAKVRVTLGAADMSKFPFEAAQNDIVEAPFGTLHIDLQALIDALEAGAVHPVTGETMTVVRMEHVGRNL